VATPSWQAAAPSLVDNWVGRKPAVTCVALVALTLVAHAIVLATPGFYGNDEWQKFDHIRLHGFWDYMQAYVALRPGPEFGFPLRPVGFLQQGAAALWMQTAPFASHLVSVVNHAVVVVAFVWVARRARVPAGAAVLAGALFAVSPLATMATGWTAASFDQLYVLFLLFAAAAVLRASDEGMSLRSAACVLLATVAALLAKETAVVAPLLVLLLGYLVRGTTPGDFSWRPFGIAFVITLIVVAAYLLFRAPAITTSFGGHSTPEYTPDLANVPINAWRLFTYPFRVKLVEISAAVYSSPWQPLAACAIHLALVVAVGASFGWHVALAYVAAYLLFLLPVLALPNPGTQCLYGAGLAMSLAIAATLVRLLATRRRVAVACLLLAAGALVAHTLAIQRHLYAWGDCQTRFLVSLDALLSQHPGTARIIVASDPGAPMRVGIRAVGAREAYVHDGQPIVVFGELTQLRTQQSPQLSAQPDDGVIRARMAATCALRPESALAN
jgi:hypothetical protein